MLAKLGLRQVECLQKAVRCREWARRSADPASTAAYLKAAESWELLARGYGTDERIHDFLASRPKSPTGRSRRVARPKNDR